jgi:glyoxylase-like metal-dependent hydrolase (beta-lactamase superfamily II)
MDLGRLTTDLEGVMMIQGVGLTSNVYLILGRSPSLIDTGAGPPENPLKPMLVKAGVKPESLRTVILTHYHPDHVGGLEELVGMDIQVLAHPAAAAKIKDDFEVRTVMDGNTVLAGHLTFKVLHTPGHTPDAICLYNHAYQILFSGDTVFPGGNFGRTDLPGGDSGKLLESLKRLSNLQVRHLLPGHETPVIGGGSKHLAASLQSALEYLSP